ncbi:MAG: hypothetical protein ACE5FZ_09105 [Nitrospiria bacterium]
MLAVRSGDELYYALNDPTGTSLILTDESGAEAGRVLYDGYGGVLSSTLSVTLTNVLAGQGAIGDPATGLVHLGNGRYYDPSLGRPLQPNPLGGPPAVPQALNRYAATSLGPVGVAETVVSGSGPLIPTYPLGVIAGRSYGVAFGMLAEAGAFHRGIFGTTYHLSVLKTSRQYVRPNGQAGRWIDDFGSDWQKIGDNFYRFGADNTEIFDALVVLGCLRKHDPSLEFRLIARRIPGSGLFDALDRPGLLGKGVFNRAGLLDLGGGLIVATGAELVFGTYWRDPYLQPWQKGGQFGVALTGAGFSWAAVIGIGWLTGGPLGIGATLLVGGAADLIWNVSIGPRFISAIGFDRQVRNLQPLSQN